MVWRWRWWESDEELPEVEDTQPHNFNSTQHRRTHTMSTKISAGLKQLLSINAHPPNLNTSAAFHHGLKALLADLDRTAVEKRLSSDSWTIFSVEWFRTLDSSFHGSLSLSDSRSTCRLQPWSLSTGPAHLNRSGNRSWRPGGKGSRCTKPGWCGRRR